MMRRLIPLVALAVAVACGSDSTTQPTFASLAGTWTLQSVNGSPLPFTISQSGTDKEELLSDVITASPNGTYTEVAQFRTTINGQSTVSTENDTGTFTLNGTAITVTGNLTGVNNGAVSGNTITLTEEGFVWVFQKQ